MPFAPHLFLFLLPNVLHAPGGAQELEHLTVEVVEHGGRPSRGATVVLFRGDELLWEGITDERGRAALARPSDGAGLIVTGTCWKMIRSPVEAGEDLVRVELPQGVVVAGTATVDGRVPGRPLWLELWPSEGWPDLPPAIYLHLARQAIGTLCQPVDRGGAFRFVVPPGWSGSLTPTRPLSDVIHFGGNRSEEKVRAPAEDLRIDLRYVRSITGRAIHPATRSPLAGCEVTCRVTLHWREDGREGDRTDFLTAVSDEDGWFRVPVRMELIDSGPGGHRIVDVLREQAGGVAQELDLEIVARGTAASTLSLGPVPLADGLELGDVELGPLRTFAFVVRDEPGQPVRGATARYGIRYTLSSEPTDEHGRSCIDVPPNLEDLLLLSPRHQKTLVTMAPAPAAEGTFVLKAASVLEVRIAGSALGSEVWISAGDQRFFRPHPPGHAPSLPEFLVGRELGSHYEFSASRRETMTRRYLPDATGVLVLPDLRPGLPLEIRLMNGSGQPVGDATTVAVKEGEHRVMELP